MRYAAGKNALGICDRCGLRYPLRMLVPDGRIPGLRVHPSCRDIPQPQEKPVRLEEGIVLKNPRPDRDDDSPGDSGEAFAEAMGWTHTFGASRRYVKKGYVAEGYVEELD